MYDVTFIGSYCKSLSAPPTLTLWVGLASGHIAAYILNIKQPKIVGFGAPQRFLNIEVIPTRM